MKDFIGIEILFLCDRKDKESWCPKPCYEECKRTTNVDHAINKQIFEEDKTKFVKERCDLIGTVLFDGKPEMEVYEEREDI